MKVPVPEGLTEEEEITFIGVFRAGYLDTKNPGRRDVLHVQTDYDLNPAAYLAGESAAINDRPMRLRKKK